MSTPAWAEAGGSVIALPGSFCHSLFELEIEHMPVKPPVDVKLSSALQDFVFFTLYTGKPLGILLFLLDLYDGGGRGGEEEEEEEEEE
ncbi:hypothetical protein EYF80_061536 [Liparis tanakae]|uniref:Uncharacterized protein n=1 Tax=Liparis tanakae TaxID=230148 RepID=A0A4Z2EHN6_9TELE|nr:hypothetical protein EYF80_061536 [Liparis tanakae]